MYLIAAGIGLRLARIGMGFRRLRRHRLGARLLVNPPFAPPDVRWYLCDAVAGPVTYGWLHPVILLPARVNELDDPLRRAIARHELIHVKRRDWLFVVIEELIRAFLWFHPAIWFVLGRIQLAREQAVDTEVVRRTNDRESYLDALVAVAEQKFSPAPLFLRKRQLALRVASLMNDTWKEMKMPKIRFAAVLSAALLVARAAIWLFPMQSPAQTPSAIVLAGDDPAAAIDPGAPLLHRAPIFRPQGTTQTGTVVAEATLNSKGEVIDARVVSGPDELRRAVLQSVLQWHYSNEHAPPSVVRISVRFDPLPSGQPKTVELPPPPTGAQTTATLKLIQFVGVDSSLAERVRAALPVHEGDQVSTASREEILAAVKQIDEHFSARLNFLPSGEATLTLILGFAIAPSPSRITSDSALPATPQRIRVGGNVQAANLVQKVTPAYPPDAKAARIQGMVQLSAVIGKDGTVQDLKLISGHPLLAPAAIEAV